MTKPVAKMFIYTMLKELRDRVIEANDHSTNFDLKHVYTDEEIRKALCALFDG